MICLDTSVELAALFNEQRRPPDTIWAMDTFSSRLLEYKVVVRLNVLDRSSHAFELANDFFETINLIDLARPVLERVVRRSQLHSVRSMRSILRR